VSARKEKLKKAWDVPADIGLENDAVISLIAIPYDEYISYRNIAEEGRRIG